MKNLKKSIIAPVFAVGLLSMGLTACDNAANTPEAEEPVESSSIETQIMLMLWQPIAIWVP